MNNWHGIVEKAQKSKDAASKPEFEEQLLKFVGGKDFVLIKMGNFSFETKLLINEKKAFRLLRKYQNN